MNVGIINVTGYAGVELARILCHHPDANVVSVTGRSAAGQRLKDVFPHLADADLPIEDDLSGSLDVVFSALPHKASAEGVAPLVRDGLRVVDISADFRLKDVGEYESWYDTAHPCPDLIEDAVFGLTELHRTEISNARLIANPGCYSTCAILALAPAVSAGVIGADIIVDGKSGVSGAGRGLSLSTHFSEVNEAVSAYSLRGHRHMPEMAQDLNLLTGEQVRLTFVPHLIPMTRGILDACYATLQEGALPPGDAAQDALLDLYRGFYDGHPFVRVVDKVPSTKHTLGNNDCIIYPTLDPRTGRLIVIGCLDNLVKGAAGQAVQNMNVMFGLEETAGLQALALYP